MEPVVRPRPNSRTVPPTRERGTGVLRRGKTLSQTTLRPFPPRSLGNPWGAATFGSTARRGQYENLPPHSEYIAQYLRVGILGLVLLSGISFSDPLVRLYALQRKDPFALFPSASVWCLIVIGVVVYGITRIRCICNCTGRSRERSITLSQIEFHLEQPMSPFP